MKAKKKVIIILIFGIILFIVGIVLWLYLGYSINKIEVKVSPIDAVELHDRMEYYHNITESIISDDTEQIIRKENPYPSEDASKYREIYINADVHNYGFIDLTMYDAWVTSNLNEDSRIIMKNGSPVIQKIEAFKTDSIYIAHLSFYSGDMNDSEIESYIRSVTFKLVSSKVSKTFDLNEAKFVYEQ